MAGLLAGNTLRRFDPIVHEAQGELPNNHAALLRFRSEIASHATHIPFKKVQVQKLISHAGQIYDKPNLKLGNMYSQKVTKKVLGRSINNLDPVERFIAPPDYISQMSKGVNIKYDSKLTMEVLEQAREFKDKQDPIVSTIPMPILMDIVDWPNKPEFKFSTIWSVWGKIKKPEMDIYHTIYYPDYTDPYYRLSITGDQFIAEYIEDPGDPKDFHLDLIHCITREFGICDFEFESQLEVKKQEYGKLLPIDDNARKEFIMYMTDEFRVYSLGRFATWRQILLDDVVKDLKVIEQLIDHRSDYNRALIGAKK